MLNRRNIDSQSIAGETPNAVCFLRPAGHVRQAKENYPALKAQSSEAQGASPGIRQRRNEALKGRRSLVLLRRPFRAIFLAIQSQG
jgi:hypothetical protein